MGVDIISTLTRKNGANFPIAAAEDIIGAFATVASTVARDAIPTAILRNGAIVRIGNTSAYYEWNGSSWVSVSFGGGGGDVVGPASSVAGRLASFGDTSGKLLADSGFSTAAVAPAAVTKATAVAGTATSFSRSDHKHDVTTAAPGALNVSGVSAAEGSASSLARSDHTHSLTGTLPVANGGTGLTALGSALTYLRVNAAGTALEWASVAAGVTAGNGLTGTTTFAVQPDGGTIAVTGSGIKVASGGISPTELASNAVTTAKIAAANVTLAKLATDACPQYRAVANAAARTGLAAGERNAGMLVRENDTGLLYVLAADLTTWVLADTSTTNQVISHASADAVGAEIRLRKARGTEASPTAVNADDVLAARTAQGHDGSAYYDAGAVDHVADAAGGTSKRTRARARLHDGTALVTTEEAVSHRVTTTDATLTVVRSIPLAADSVLRVRYAIVGAQNSSSNRAIRETSVTVRRSGSGDPVIVGASDNIPLFKDDATWGGDTEIGHQINTTSDALEIIVKGKAATTIVWRVDVVYGAR